MKALRCWLQKKKALAMLRQASSTISVTEQISTIRITISSQGEAELPDGQGGVRGAGGGRHRGRRGGVLPDAAGEHPAHAAARGRPVVALRTAIHVSQGRTHTVCVFDCSALIYMQAWKSFAFVNGV